MTLYVDMDGTIAQWQEVPYFERLLEEGYYRNLPPMEEVLNGIKGLIADGVECYTLSAYLPNSEFAKNEKDLWLNEHLPEIDSSHRIWVPYGDVKSTCVGRPLTSNDYLLDDYTKNLNEWRVAGGNGIKLMNGINDHNHSWGFDRVYYDNIELGTQIKEIMNYECEQDITSELNVGEDNIEVPGIKI